MGLIGGELGYRLLRTLSPRGNSDDGESAYSNVSKLEVLLGKTIWDELRGKSVLDFGCGTGEPPLRRLFDGVAPPLQDLLGGLADVVLVLGEQDDLRAARHLLRRLEP